MKLTIRLIQGEYIGRIERGREVVHEVVTADPEMTKELLLALLNGDVLFKNPAYL